MPTPPPLTLPFPAVVVLVAVLGMLIHLHLRTRLTPYQRVPEDHHTVLDPKLDQVAPAASKPLSILDEFLRALKVFAHLDRHAFHALTRHMVTQRLEPGETLVMDDSVGFATVVDGSVGVYTHVAGSASTRDLLTVEFRGQRYQLLNVVKTGSPLLLLLGVVSRVGEGGATPSMASPFLGGLPRRTSFNELPRRAAFHDLPRRSFSNSGRPAKTTFELILDLGSDSGVVPPIVVRATEACTLAVVPTALLAHVISRYPKAASQIVQVLFTRLDRVTFNTCLRYLNISDEVYLAEERLNENVATVPALLHDPVFSEPRVAAWSPRSRPPLPLRQLRHVVVGLRQCSGPGDLLLNVPLARVPLRLTDPPANFVQHPFSADEETPELALRRAVAEALFAALGIDRRESFLRQVLLLDLAHSQMLSFFEVLPDDSDDDGDSAAPGYDTLLRHFAAAVEFLLLGDGEELAVQDDPSPGLAYVVDGALQVARDGVPLHRVPAGGTAGYLSTLVTHTLQELVASVGPLRIALVSKARFDRFVDRYHQVLLPLAHRLLALLPRRLHEIDLALEWVHLLAGSIVALQGEPANGVYLVLTGRLRAVVETALGMQVQAEYGHGELVGEVEVLTASVRTLLLVAVRDTECARIPRALMTMLVVSHPSTMLEVLRLVATRVQELNQALAPATAVRTHSTDTVLNTAAFTRYRTITVYPLLTLVPLAQFAERLVAALTRVGGQVTVLDQATVLTLLGRRAFDDMWLNTHLARMEARYDTVVYVADAPVQLAWSRTCVAQADCTLLVADATLDPRTVGEYEQAFVKNRTGAKTDLVLVHPDIVVEPGSTHKWLKLRPYVHTHHHVQMGLVLPVVRQQLRLNMLKDRVNTLLRDEWLRLRRDLPPAAVPHVHSHKNDFMRLARILQGQAVGLVLGGGGARGFAHLGVIKALEEAGIPVDMVGGTSMGAFVGGLYAREHSMVGMYLRAMKFAGRAALVWRMAWDLTYPYTAYTTGHEFNRGVWKAFGYHRIEDSWLLFFANSTNITHLVMEIHTRGHAWRYVRALMLLAGLLPPVCDDGLMLLDGGYLDNLPVAEMRRRGAKTVFAVDVGLVDDRLPVSYGDTLSGFWALLNHWNPFLTAPDMPSMADIQLRLAYVLLVNALDSAKAQPGVVYLRPPIENYATLDFGRFEEIYLVGEIYARNHVAKLRRQGALPTIAGVAPTLSKKPGHRRNLF